MRLKYTGQYLLQIDSVWICIVEITMISIGTHKQQHTQLTGMQPSLAFNPSSTHDAPSVSSDHGFPQSQLSTHLHNTTIRSALCSPPAEQMTSAS
jgi:hypothetical protein